MNLATPSRTRRKNIDEFGDAHELTFSCHRRLPLLTNATSRRLFLNCLDAARARCNFEVWAYVLMPNHVHVLVWPGSSNVKISQILRQIKQPFANRFVTLLRNAPKSLERLRVGDGHRVWQAGGGYDRNLYSAKAIWSAIEYMHQNPVRAGLAKYAEDWVWSSARYYLDGTQGEFKIDGCDVWQ